jgi:FkbM family methyltransferase
VTESSPRDGSSSGRVTVLHRARRLANVFGIEVRRLHDPLSFASRRVALMRRLGIDLVIDVGANEGQYGSALRRLGYPGRIISFEPVGEAYAKLELRAAADPSWECRRRALGAEAGAAVMSVAANLYSSSLLPIDPSHVAAAPDSATVRTEEVAVARLDDEIAELDLTSRRVLLKLDVQGFERDVLAGAGQTLPSVLALETELSMKQLYSGQALWRDMVDLIETHGLGLHAVEEEFVDPRTGETLQLNGLFVREAPHGGDDPRQRK